MRVKAWLFLLSSLLAIGCTVASGDFDACKLIVPSEIEAVQGEAVLDSKSGERKTGGFTIAQCYYTLPSHTKSVSLEVTRPDPEQGTPSRPRDRWKKLFHGDADQQEGEKESGKPQPVSGVGDEAFWSGNPMVGALYVLKDDSYLRISIGGAEDASIKIRKTMALAQRALKRLPNFASQ
jgi:hypothetical protein